MSQKFCVSRALGIAKSLDPRDFHGLEKDITEMFMEQFFCGRFDPRLPMCSSMDTVVREFSFRHGRADIVVFHSDGSASVIEVKDGTKGYGHVVSGIGQSSLYAAQLAMNNGALTKVRKCLLWTSTGNASVDGLIEAACEQSGTVPLPFGRLADHLMHKEAVRMLVSGEA